MSPSGKAPDFDSGIRRFESCHPSHDPLAQLAEQLPFKQWVRSSNLRRVTKSSEHFGSTGEKPSDFKVFGIFYGRKFSKYSMAQWKRRRGSNRGWTSAFPYSSGIVATAPFFRGLRRRDSGKNEEKSFTKLWTLDCWFSQTNDQRLFCAQKGRYRLEVRNERRKSNFGS